jgi:hypothetical protein
VSDTGAIIARVLLIRPNEKVKLALTELDHFQWSKVSFEAWASQWNAEVSNLPPLRPIVSSSSAGYCSPFGKP